MIYYILRQENSHEYENDIRFNGTRNNCDRRKPAAAAHNTVKCCPKQQRAMSFIQSGERNGAIGSVAGLDVELDRAKALYQAALAHNVNMNRNA